MRRVARDLAMLFPVLVPMLLATAARAGDLPPAPKPAGVVAGTPAAAGHSYVVFFEEWSGKLGPEGAKAVAQAAENARAHPGVPVLVTGYAANDSGSQTANQLVARLRAQMVVDELVHDGLDVDRVKGEAVGASSFALDPIEARRVTISVGAE